MSSRTIRFTERATLAVDPSKINEAEGYIDDALICGFTSKNNRDYLREMFKADYRKYEGARSFLGHHDKPPEDRMVGWWTAVYLDPAGLPRGRFNVYKENANAGQIFEAARRNPTAYGFSHVAVCKTKRKNGRDQIATTSGMFCESITHPGTNMKLSEYVAAGLNKFPDSPGFKALKEMGDLPMDMADDAPPMDAAVSDTDPVKTAFVTALHGLVDQYESGDITDAELMTKFKDVLKAHVKLSGKTAPADDKPADDAPAEESKKRDAKLAALTVENIALKAGVTLTEVQAKAVLGLTDDADRKTLIESFKPVKEVAGQKVTSGERSHAGTKLAETTDAPPTDGVKYAERLRSRD